MPETAASGLRMQQPQMITSLSSVVSARCDLKSLASKEPGSISGQGGGGFDYRRFESRRTIDEAHSGVSDHSGRGCGRAEEIDQAVGRGEHRDRVESSPRIVTLQNWFRTDVEAKPGRIDDGFGQGRNIAKTEIHSLPGNGMHCVGSIANQRDSVAVKVLGKAELQRPDGARANWRDLAEIIAGALLERCLEFVARQSGQTLRLQARLGPDDRGVLVGQGQESERSPVDEMLDGNPIMRLLQPDIADDGGMVIVPASERDPGKASDVRRDSIGGDQKRCCDLRTI